MSKEEKINKVWDLLSEIDLELQIDKSKQNTAWSLEFCQRVIDCQSLINRMEFMTNYYRTDPEDKDEE